MLSVVHTIEIGEFKKDLLCVIPLLTLQVLNWPLGSFLSLFSKYFESSNYFLQLKVSINVYVLLQRHQKQ